MAKGHTLQGYGGIKAAIPQCALKLGIPVIDSTVIDDDRIYDTLRFPMAVCRTATPDDPPYHGLSYAPLEYVAKLYKELGADVHNLDV